MLLVKTGHPICDFLWHSPGWTFSGVWSKDWLPAQFYAWGLERGSCFIRWGPAPSWAQTLSLPGSACLPYCCWLRSWIWWDLEELDFPGMSSDFLFPSAPSTIDWAALFISLIFTHPSAVLFSHLLCWGPEGPACSSGCVCPQAWESPCGFGTMGEDTSLPSSPWWQAGRLSQAS